MPPKRKARTPSKQSTTAGISIPNAQDDDDLFDSQPSSANIVPLSTNLTKRQRTTRSNSSDRTGEVDLSSDSPSAARTSSDVIEISLIQDSQGDDQSPPTSNTPFANKSGNLRYLLSTGIKCRPSSTSVANDTTTTTPTTLVTEQRVPFELPLRPSPLQCSLERFNTATSHADLDTRYITYDAATRVPRPFSTRNASTHDAFLASESKSVAQPDSDQPLSTKKGSKQGKGTAKSKQLELDKLEKQWAAIAQDIKYTHWLSLQQLNTIFLTLSGAIDLSVDSIYARLDQSYRPDPSSSPTSNEQSRTNPHNQFLTNQAQSFRSPALPTTTAINIDFYNDVHDEGLHVYKQLIQINPSQLFIDPLVIAPLIQSINTKSSINIDFNNIIKQADKYSGDYDGYCGYCDFLNITRSAGLWFDLNHELYSHLC